MTTFTESKTPKEFLTEELAKRKNLNPAYSLRAFARQLKLSPGELSEIMAGKRHLSLKSALRTARALGLNQSETKQLLQMAQLGKSLDFKDRELLEPLNAQKVVQQISNDLFHIVSDWYCFAILNLAECKSFKWNSQYIAQKLTISVHEARLAVERLERAGLVETRQGKKRVVKRSWGYSAGKRNVNYNAPQSSGGPRFSGCGRTRNQRARPAPGPKTSSFHQNRHQKFFR